MTRPCQKCQLLFETDNPKRLYCSVRCRRKQGRDLHITRYPSSDARQSASYYAKNKRRIQETQRRYRQQHRQSIAIQNRLYRWENRDKILEIRKASEHKRRAQRLNQTSLTDHITPEQWKEIKNRHNNQCVFCRLHSFYLTQDHKIPLSRGGSNSASNIVPACKSCNSRKSTKTYSEYLQAIGA